MYRVLRDFADLQDNRHVYHAGDKYPRDGVTTGTERLASLQSGQNAAGMPLIEAVPEDPAEKPIEKRPKRTKK